MSEEIRNITMNEDLFGECVMQVGILKEMYDKITVTPQMNGFQKKILLTNKKKNLEVLNELEKICDQN